MANLKQMIPSKCQLAWQHGSRAIFAKIVLSAYRTEDGKPAIAIPDDVDEFVAVGIRFGFQLFREACWGPDGSVTATVDEIDAVPCDTTITSVAFVTFHALAVALKPEVRSAFVFDQESGRFSIAQFP